MARMSPYDAREVLRHCELDPHNPPDFFTLRADTVGLLLNEARNYRYRKPRNANGSRGRYFYRYVLQQARQHTAP